MELLVNVCGHGLCRSCVETLFPRGSGSCPECEVPLRRGDFKLQLFEDATIDKEVDIRRRILRDFCKTQDDFGTLREYNDYLEMVEDFIFNLANDIDVEDTRRRIQEYKEANREFISKNRNKMSQEYLQLEDILAEERRMEAKRKQEDALFEVATKTAKLRDKQKLIDDLMFSDKDGKAILEEHHKNAQFSSAADFKAAKRDYVQEAPKIIEAKPFVYEELVLNFDGPEPPLSEEIVYRNKYSRHIRAAEAWEKAAGYRESIGALRAIQEAMSGLYFDQF